MIKIILLIAWIVMSLGEGRRDGFFYHYRNSSIQMKGENIHWIYFLVRGIVLALISTILYLTNPSISSMLFVAGLVLIFSIIHNGMYYETRKTLSNGNLYPKGWKSSSTSSEAVLEFGWKERKALAIIGAIGIIISFLINI